MKTFLANEELDGRLNCFGEFNETDKICLNTCALNINCAIAKNKFFTYQIFDDVISPLNNYEADY